MGEWGTYEAAREDKGTLAPLVIEGEEFIFPKSPPASFGLEMMRLARRHNGRIPDDLAIGLMPELIGQERVDRLATLTSFEEFMGVIGDLLLKYGFLKPSEGDEDLNPSIEGPISPISSSTTSEPLKPVGDNPMEKTS